tara:strand:+ start:9262 stop:10155 length:894 start_codon:yes stop_codon:yes gene_type:complete
VKNIAVISHDAGGAEILSNLINLNEANYYFILEGPAKTVFKKVLGVNSIPFSEKILSFCDSIICSTSWQSYLEINAIIIAKKLDKFIIVVFDHWVNYQERLTYKGEILIPNEIWVTDKYAESITRAIFKDVCIKNKPNLYIEKTVKKIKNQINMNTNNFKTNILYVSDNISEHAEKYYGDSRYFGYNEFDSIKYMINNISFITKKDFHIRIRPHPSDYDGKYEKIVTRYKDLNISISKFKSLESDIADSDIVIGAQTMAMIVALHAGRKVISSIPHGCKELSLPHQGIIKLKDLIND